MPVPILSDIQLRVERSIYEAIRLQLVAQGYLPDITLPQYSDNTVGDTQWQTDLAAIAQANQFAIDVFGDSSSLQKGMKRTPRIAIITRRIMPGDIGKNPKGGFAPNPLDPDNTQFLEPSYQSANLHIDINVVPADADQDRMVHAILASAISTLKYLPFYDDPTSRFLIRQFNFFDLPDNKNGISEKVYSYEIPDLYLYDGDITTGIPTIQEITVNVTAAELKAIYMATGNLLGPYVSKDVIYMDLNGLRYSLPEDALTDEDGNKIQTESGQTIIT